MIDIEVGNTFDRRSALFLTTGAILTSVLVLRMLQMQVFNYRDYKKKSENNSYRIQINMPERGKILSTEGIPISRDTPIYRIYIVPEESDDIDGLIKILTDDLNLRQKTLKRIFAQMRKQQRFQPVLISEHTDWKNLAKIQAKNLPGVHISSGYARVYEMGESGAHIFGYVGAPKNPKPNAPFFTTGILGLEKKCNPFLQVEKVTHFSDNSKEPLVFPASVVYLTGHTAVKAPDHYRHYQRIQNCRAHKTVDDYQSHAQHH